MSRTEPRSLGTDPVADKHLLLEGRYGTRETCDEWGTEDVLFQRTMDVQVTGLEVLDEMAPGRLNPEYLEAVRRTANLQAVSPDRIRELERQKGHDVIAINTAWGEASDKLKPGSSSLINFLRTSADSTETAKAVKAKRSLHVIANSAENLRDITLGKSLEWIDVLSMDTTHLYDALPSVAGRPLSFYCEMLQSGLEFLKFVHDFSLIAKWGDATGNHHAATVFDVDGMELQKRYAQKLGLRYMDAPAQIPGREFNADVMYALTRLAGTLGNFGNFIQTQRSDDVGLYIYDNPDRKEGSSAMPQKTEKGGNPTAEEQAQNLARKMLGILTTSVGTIEFDYARDLSGSASDRIDIAAAFRYTDHVIRKLSEVVYYLKINEQRSLERIHRSYDVTTSARVMTRLVSGESPLCRKDAHRLMGELATYAYRRKTPFAQVLASDERITSRLSREEIEELTDSLTYIGKSKEIVRKVYDNLHGRKTFDYKDDI